MKVLLITSSFLPSLGGAEIGLHNIALKLTDKGHQVTVLTSFLHRRRLRKTGAILPYRVIAFPPRFLHCYDRFPLVGRLLIEVFYGWLDAKFRFDFWHVTFGYPTGVSVAEFGRKRRIPHLVRCVGEDIQIDETIGYGMRLDSEKGRRIREGLARAQLMVATTETVRNEYIGIGIDPKVIEMIPNGVDLSRFSAFQRGRKDLRLKFGLDEDCLVFLCVGRYHPKKNFSQVVELAKRLEELEAFKEVDWRFLIAGGGVESLRSEVDKSVVGHRVMLIEPSYHGADCQISRSREIQLPSDEVLEWYSVANVFLMPSIVESFGIVTIEAMAMGLPVIAADAPGNRDILDGGEFGILYDGSTEGLVSALKLVISGEERNRLVALSRKRALEFDWSYIVDRYVGLYERAIRSFPQSQPA